MRKKLSFLDLIDEYEALSPNFLSHDLTKEQRRDVWKWAMNRLYPDLECCPFCGSTVNDARGVVYTPEKISFSPHHMGHSALIECDKCNLTFEGVSNWNYKKSVIEQWNEVKR